jgi:hypothetical protein
MEGLVETASYENYFYIFRQKYKRRTTQRHEAAKNSE